MNQSFRDYAAPVFGSGRNSRMQAALSHSHHRRGNSLVASRDSSSDDKLDLFSRSRRSVSLPSDDDPDVSLNLAKISVAKSVRNGLDDLLTSAEDGKHDYDWLLTPPETPLNSTIEGNGFQQKRAAPRSSSVSRSATTTKSSSRLSVVAPDHSNIGSSRPARSSSVTRPSISYTPSSSMMSSSMIRSSSNNILNTSSASVSSYIRPSSPMSRSSLSTARSSTPCRSTPSSRHSTPSKVRSSPSLSSSSSSSDIVKPRSSVSSRPSTPTSSRPQISSNITPTPTLISSSRPSTPTRRSSISGVANLNLSVSTRRVSSNGRSSGQSSTSRPSSPSPRIRSHHQQTAVLPSEFSLDTPPNLRTTLPDRPISAGRSRPSASASTAAAKVNSESQGSAGVPRRSASPIVSRGRSNSMEPPQGGRSTRVSSGGHNNTNDIYDPKRSMYVSESQQGRRSAKGPTPTDHVNGFGRTISKKSLDMAIRHMDIRSGPGGTRPVSGTVLYPQSIRCMASTRTQSGHASSGNNLSYNSSSSSSSELNGTLSSSVSNGSSISENGRYYDNGSLVNRTREDNYSSSNNMGSSNGGLFGRVSEVDIFESSRYDALLLKEDAKNTNWLHSGDGMSDQGLIFDNGLESLPEPFGLS